MAAPSYTTDLQPVDDAEDTTGWAEMTGRTSGGAATQEDRAYIQGNYCVSQSTGAATARTVGLQYDYGSNITWTAGFVFLAWLYWQAPKAIGTWTDGGIRFGVGSTAGNVKLWNSVGNDYGRNPYGGWENVAIDPTYSADETVGSPVTGNYRIFCSAPYLLQSVSKGNPHCVDVIRYGRAQIKVEYGDLANGYGTFSGMATANDDNAARWGLFSLQKGSYLWKGLMSLGTASNAVDFRDANRNIIVDDTPRTYAAFNRIEIRNASSRVDWTAINVAPLNSSALSKGEFEVVDVGAKVQLNSCTFTDMSTFILRSGTTVSSCIFRRCGQITQNGSIFQNAIFDKSAAAINLVVDDITKVTSCTFNSSGTGHAIQGFSAAGDYVLTSLSFSGYAASNGSTGNEAIYVTAAAGVVNLTIAGSGNIPSIRTAGATVNVLTSQKSFKVTGMVNGSEIGLYKASDKSELYHLESYSGGTVEYTYTYSGDVSAYLVVFALDYIAIKMDVTLANADQSIQVQQQKDRQYSNPT